MNERLFDQILAPKHVIKELYDVSSSQVLINSVKQRLSAFPFKVNGEKYLSVKLLFAQESINDLIITKDIVGGNQLGLFARVEDDNVMTPEILIKNYKSTFYILSGGEVSFIPISQGCTIVNDRDFSFYRIQRGVPEAWPQNHRAFPYGVPVPA